MEFRRIPGLPPYVFTIIDGLKHEALNAGRDIIDLGFGNPDIPSHPTAVNTLRDAAQDPKNHRYSLSRGIPELRQAVANRYQQRFGVTLDPTTQIISTIGAKEGFSHLMWVLLQPGDTALVPAPSYPIHIWGPYLAGGTAQEISLGTSGNADEYITNTINAWEQAEHKPRAIVLSFPHNPTTTYAEKHHLQRIVDWAQDKPVTLVHDFAYAETGFDGWLPPSILECDGATNVAVEHYSMTKSFSMAGWRSAFLLGNAEVVEALRELKSYLDYGTFQPIQLAAAAVLDQEPDFPLEVNEKYEARRNALCDGLDRIGWKVPRPKGTMFLWLPIPEKFRELGSVEFAKLMLEKCDVAVSPGVGFGGDGDGFVRFALIEDPDRISEACDRIGKNLGENLITG